MGVKSKKINKKIKVTESLPRNGLFFEIKVSQRLNVTEEKEISNKKEKIIHN